MGSWVEDNFSGDNRANAAHGLGNPYATLGAETYKTGQGLKRDARNNRAYQDNIQEQINAMMKTRPDYKGTTMPDGTLKSNFKLTKTHYNSNVGELDKRLNKIKNVNAGENFSNAQDNVMYLQDQAYSDAPSEWANRQLEFQDLQDQESREDLLKNSDRARESAYSQLAMRGGLDSGARERISESFGNNLMEQQQLQNRNNQMAKLGVMSDDEANKMSIARDLPGMNLQLDSYNTGLQNQNRQAQFAKTNAWSNMATHESDAKFGEAQNRKMFNKNTAINDRANYNVNNLSAWQDQMKAFSADKSGDAMSRAGDKKSTNPVSKAMFG